MGRRHRSPLSFGDITHMAMTALTKDQVRELTPEQQEAIAAAELQRVRSRQRLLERARRGMSVWAALLTGLTSGFAMICIAFPRLVPIAIIAVVALVTFHVARLHKRLDAGRAPCYAAWSSSFCSISIACLMPASCKQPAAPNAGIAPWLTIEHHWPGVGEPGRSAAPAHLEP